TKTCHFEPRERCSQQSTYSILHLRDYDNDKRFTTSSTAARVTRHPAFACMPNQNIRLLVSPTVSPMQHLID
ncbi:MAG: hypothetical protein WCA26_05260, partial [Xanthobacteraceae bacterium]